MKKIVYTVLIATFIVLSGFNYPAGIKIAKLKYNGGGDWYANKTSLPNLIAFCKLFHCHNNNWLSCDL